MSVPSVSTGCAEFSSAADAELTCFDGFMRPRFDTFVEKGEVLSHSAYKHPAVMSLIVPWRSHFEKALLANSFRRIFWCWSHGAWAQEVYPHPPVDREVAAGRVP